MVSKVNTARVGFSGYIRYYNDKNLWFFVLEIQILNNEHSLFMGTTDDYFRINTIANVLEEASKRYIILPKFLFN